MKLFSLLILMLVSVSQAHAVNVISLGQVVYPVVAIPINSTTSGAITTSGMSLVGCLMPSAFTGATISFTASATLTGTYEELDNSSGKVTYTVTQGKYISINPTDFYGVQFFKIVSASTEGTARNLICSMKGI